MKDSLISLTIAHAWAAIVLGAASLGLTASAQEYDTVQIATLESEERHAAELTILNGDAATALSLQLQRIERVRASLLNGDGFLRHADETTLTLILDRQNARTILAETYGRQYGSRVAPSAPALGSVDSAIDRVWSDVNRLAPQFRSPAGRAVSDALNAALASTLRAAVPSATYVSARLTDTAWTIETNALRAPVARSIGGLIFYRVPGNPLVVCRELTIRRSYFEQTPRGQPGTVAFGGIRLQTSV